MNRDKAEQIYRGQVKVNIGKTASTGSLINHLRRHKKEFQEFSKERLNVNKQKEEQPSTSKQPSVQDLFKKKERFTTSHPRHIQITKAVTRMITTDLHPYSLVEEASFKNLMDILEPRYQLPSRTTFSRTLVPELYKSERERIKSTITEDAKSLLSMSLTTDTWTSRANDSFMSLTLHYLSKDFDYKSFVLGNKNITEAHTSLFLLGQLEEMVENWELPKIPIYVLSDNAANIKAALDKSSWERIPCFAHTLQLAIHDAESEVPGINEMCKRARNIVGHYSHSSSARARLKNIQKRLSLPDHELLQDVATRWNSRYDMLSRLLEQKEAVSADIAASADIENLTTSQWKLASGVVEILKPFKEVTTQLSSEKYPTISMVAPALHVIEDYLLNFLRKGEQGTGLSLARALSKAIKSRFPIYRKDKMYIAPMILDPRYKTKIFSEAEQGLALTTLKSCIANLPKPTTTSPSASTELSADLTQPETSKQSDVKTLWSTFDSSDDETSSSSNLVDKELDFYLEKKRISTVENPLHWWKEKPTRLWYLRVCNVSVSGHYE
ncbi:zinc finger BED domain-containing protein 4-like [Macrosteles quadrilineatus]|uniref:zinc finger BED domain-containing protein 4-like n=1 Tax=Macrosteles quadrilineatus TaxID=74068 RepID=UPI0023E29C65|nr:zinc finger BED domain-containing protein 4-like [Macrosteles quadrilineatus]